jgi:sugar phosphate isomerase/epimerase
MKKIAVAIAHKEALPEAFVVFRGFEESIPLAADLGYDGVELALRKAGDINGRKIGKLLSDANMEVSAISTGQIFAENGLTLMDPDDSRRQDLFKIFFELIDLAADFGGKINIGRVRGSIIKGEEKKCLELFDEGIRKTCGYAANRNVDILLEPVNRYEINFINSIKEAGELIDDLNIPNLYIMPDLFHMNIEDAVIEDELVKYRKYINYIHFADSNRLAPGWGHTNFKSIQETLESINYNGWTTMEILPEPEPLKAAFQAINFMNNL